MLLGHRARGSPVKLLSARRILATAVHPAAALHGRSSSSSSSASVGSAKAEDGPSQPQTRLPKFLLKEAIVAPEGYNRYRSVLPALATNICGGSVYAWSIFNGPLTRELGVVASCSADWALTDVVPVFSVNAACLGACTFATGKWLEAVGPRAAGAVAANCFSSGLVIGGIGVMYHQLPLVYLGYGFLGGCGAGLSYVSPVSNMSRWFPDKRGLATGSAVMGFGGGAMVAAPLDSYLLSVYSEPPTRLGDIDAVQVVNEGGARMADIGGGQMGEVVVATGSDVAGTALDAGVYIVGTGNTGVAATFCTVGLLYGSIMAIAASQHRVAPDGYIPEGYTPPKEEAEAAKHFVHIDDSLKTPQFWMLWSVVCLNGIAGVSVLSTGKDIMMDIFGNAPASAAIVTGGFAASYVMGLSAMNMAGRMGWGGASDYLGRKQTYMLFGCFAPIAVSMPTLTTMAANGENGLLPLGVFAGSTMLAMSFYGGVFGCMPSTITWLFGGQYAGGIHGRMITAWSAASLLGPNTLTYLRARSYNQSAEELTSKIDPERFEIAFGSSPSSDHLSELLEAKSVTIGRLMEIAPEGTMDPSPNLYDTTLYSMGGVLLVAFGVASALSPAGEKYLTAAAQPAAAAAAAAASSATAGAPVGLEGVAEGEGRMQVRPPPVVRSDAEKAVEEMEAAAAAPEPPNKQR